MAGRTVYRHAIVALLSIGGVYMATFMQWPISLRFSPIDGSLSNGTNIWMPTVLLISLDGLKPDYLNSGHMPTLKGLFDGINPTRSSIKTGVLTAESMIPVSPSLTFPNHWTLQTGLLPSSHGIIANDFHIQSSNGTDESFYYTDPSRSWNSSWWHGTAIWERLESLDFKTANLMWPGPPVTSKNIESTYFQKYEKNWTLDDRFDKIISWLDKEDRLRPQFICAYAPDVDSVTHSFGPDDTIKKVTETLQNVDSFILDLLHGIEMRNAASIIDVIIVSDHGMTRTSNDRLVYLEDLLGSSLYSRLKHWDGWPNVGLRYGSKSDVEEATAKLKAKEKIGKGRLEIATRDEVVSKWGWNNNRLVQDRMADLWILPELGWSITTKEEMTKFSQEYRPKGNHGYHAESKDMHAFFLAFGPSFNPATRQAMKPFANVEIHNLVMDLLRIPDTDRVLNNGTSGFWHRYLQKR